MTEPLILYSANTWLAYMVSERYFGGHHYVWCTPHFDSSQHSALDASTPPTSSPAEIWRSLLQESKRGDRHSAKIKENRIGILRGATLKLSQGIITEKQKNDIAAIVDRAEARDFRPLIYLIPFSVAHDHLSEVPVPDRAHPLSVEYVIDSLPRGEFDVIEPLL